MARKIILKENGLSGSSNTPSGYRYIGYDGSVVSEKSGATISSISGTSYKSYIALLTQDGSSNAPTATVLENTLGYPIVWTYFNNGFYYTGSITPFDADKIYIQIQNSGDGSDFLGADPATRVFYHSIDNINSRLQIITSDAGVNSDGMLSRTPIEIRVYNE